MFANRSQPNWQWASSVNVDRVYKGLLLAETGRLALTDGRDTPGGKRAEGILTPLPGSPGHTGTGPNQDRTGLRCGSGILPGSWSQSAQWGTGWSRCHPVGGKRSKTARREVQPTVCVQMAGRFHHIELCCQTAFSPFRASIAINRKLESIPKNWGFFQPLCKGLQKASGSEVRGWGSTSLSLPTQPPTVHPGGQAHLLEKGGWQTPPFWQGQ